MTTEQMIAAKVALLRAEATAQIWVAIFMLIVAAACILCHCCIRYRHTWAEARFILCMTALTIGVLGAIALPVSFYRYRIAELSARAEMANYRLIEINQR